MLPRLFRKYAGPADGDARAIGGIGLGLVICKGLVEAHGGRIRAESEGAGKGSRFTFTISVVEDPRQSEPADPAAVPSGTLSETREPARILVVDDDPQMLRFVRDALTAADYRTLVTGDHSELSRLIRTENPQLVLLDLMLPGTDGIALIESIPELSELPVLFISG